MKLKVADVPIEEGRRGEWGPGACACGFGLWAWS